MALCPVYTDAFPVRSKAYWSISPALDRPKRYHQMKVGFENDYEYLGALGRLAYARVAVIDPSLTVERDIETFRKKTLLALLQTPNLGMISVWHPTFLGLLLDAFKTQVDSILESLAQQDKHRYQTVRSIVKKGLEDDSYQRIWPELKVISCWMDGPSKIYAEQLRVCFPRYVFKLRDCSPPRGWYHCLFNEASTRFVLWDPIFWNSSINTPMTSACLIN